MRVVSAWAPIVQCTGRVGRHCWLRWSDWSGERGGEKLWTDQWSVRAPAAARWPGTLVFTSPGLGITTTMTADRTFDVKSSSVKRLCHFVIATAYNKQIPQICHWLIDQEQVEEIKTRSLWLCGHRSKMSFWFVLKNPLTRERESHYKIRLTKLLENGSDKNSSEYDLMPCCHNDDIMYPGHASASNITLVLILSAIFIILLFSAIITCTKRRKQTQVENIYSGVKWMVSIMEWLSFSDWNWWRKWVCEEHEDPGLPDQAKSGPRGVSAASWSWLPRPRRFPKSKSRDISASAGLWNGPGDP